MTVSIGEETMGLLSEILRVMGVSNATSDAAKPGHHDMSAALPDQLDSRRRTDVAWKY